MQIKYIEVKGWVAQQLHLGVNSGVQMGRICTAWDKYEIKEEQNGQKWKDLYLKYSYCTVTWVHKLLDMCWAISYKCGQNSYDETTLLWNQSFTFSQ